MRKMRKRLCTLTENSVSRGKDVGKLGNGRRRQREGGGAAVEASGGGSGACPGRKSGRGGWTESLQFIPVKLRAGGVWCPKGRQRRRRKRKTSLRRQERGRKAGNKMRRGALGL